MDNTCAIMQVIVKRRRPIFNLLYGNFVVLNEMSDRYTNDVPNKAE